MSGMIVILPPTSFTIVASAAPQLSDAQHFFLGGWRERLWWAPSDVILIRQSIHMCIIDFMFHAFCVGPALGGLTNCGRWSLVHETMHSILELSSGHRRHITSCPARAEPRRLEIFCSSSGYLSIMIPSRLAGFQMVHPMLVLEYSWGHGQRQTVWPGCSLGGSFLGVEEFFWGKKPSIKTEAMDLSDCRYSTFQGNHLWSQVEGVFGDLTAAFSEIQWLPWISGCFGQVQNPSSPGAARSWRVKSSESAEKSPRLDKYMTSIIYSIV